MGKEQRTMSHNSRIEPYPTLTSAGSAPTRALSQDFNSATGERSSTAWSHDDDTRLMQFRAQGMNWGPIAANFPSKTANACRKRHERLMEKKSAESWDGVKIEDLARAYLECREAMWRILAEAVGEKWQTVELKCMEKGLKTLQTAGRAARRHSVRQSSPEHSQSASEFDDSGLGFSHSPASTSHLILPNPQQHQAPSPIFQGLAPMHNQHRTGSISSASSATAPVSQPTTHPHHHQSSQQQFSYPSNHPQTSLYGTTAPSSSSYMTSGFGSMSFSPTSTFTPSHSLPSFSRGFEAPSRTTQPSLPPLSLPSLLTTSRSHQEPITASY